MTLLYAGLFATLPDNVPEADFGVEAAGGSHLSRVYTFCSAAPHFVPSLP